MDSIRPQKEGDFRKEVNIKHGFLYSIGHNSWSLVIYEVFLVNDNIESVNVKSVHLIFFGVKYLLLICISGSVVLDSVPGGLSLYPCIQEPLGSPS